MRLTNVSFRYARGGDWVLDGVDLTLEPGTVAEVTGVNGTGKSTLLRLVAGLLRPVRGEVSGRPARVGYAPERFPAEQPFTVRGYLEHQCRARRVPAAEIGEWAERLDYAHLLETRLPALSKGSAHKVGLTQALLGRPELLLLDEPVAGLDPEARDRVPAIAAELAAAGTRVAVIDHQGEFRALPGVVRWRVAGGKVAALPPEEPADPRHAVLEVKVSADRADALAATLAADGHEILTRRTLA
ncbi:ATP-binding cassette domain-containing protein [Bailinhaonella thermotolerans]|uniref:ATP-binding cassette domain-containing protein n=1 Tax=Bailinhaonella thermotolerans TaxID=1070861 RepID=A0A3A4ADE0_9ACTN|nr:ATP-binding cassette domain-containing protein [Bailinhaonella thermotolerans]RJL24767.1 ATP-binding cassette domain-containing protein [Bailinhaonella thermotolerans]